MTQKTSYVGKIAIDQLLAEIALNPEVWDKNPARLYQEGPHRECHDVMLRYKDETDNLRDGFADYADFHTAEWYAAVDSLPAARVIVQELATAFQAEQIGAVLIYKLPPGSQVYPHVDTGWHAEFYSKFNVCLASNGKSFFGYTDEFCTQEPGDIHFFRNDIEHGVVNAGDTDHIVMVVCLRLDSGYRVQPSTASWLEAGSPIRGLSCHQAH